MIIVLNSTCLSIFVHLKNLVILRYCCKWNVILCWLSEAKIQGCNNLLTMYCQISVMVAIVVTVVKLFSLPMCLVLRFAFNNGLYRGRVTSKNLHYAISMW